MTLESQISFICCYGTRHLWVQREQVVPQHPHHAKPNRRNSEPTDEAADGSHPWQSSIIFSSQHEKGPPQEATGLGVYHPFFGC